MNKKLRNPLKRKTPKGKRTLEGWEKHNDEKELCRKDVQGWMQKHNIALSSREFEYEIERFRDSFSGKRYKDWVATFRNYLRSRFLEQDHWDYKESSEVVKNNNRQKVDKNSEAYARGYR